MARLYARQGLRKADSRTASTTSAGVEHTLAGRALTRLEELRALKAKKEAAKAIVHVLDQYVDLLWDERRAA